MTFLKRYALWILTFLGFPLGSLAAVTIAGSITSLGKGALAGLISGAVLGLAQWLVLRPRGISAYWIAATAAGMAVGTGIAAAITDSGTTTGDLVIRGAISGAAVGIAQAFMLRTRLAILWPITLAATWALAWLITANVIVDKERGYVTFGASGAITATAIAGLVLYGIIRPDFRASSTATDRAIIASAAGVSGGSK